MYVKPWPNGDERQRKFGSTASLRTQTCDGWPNGLASKLKFDVSCKKSHFSAALRSPVLRKIIVKVLLHVTIFRATCLAKKFVASCTRDFWV